MGTGIAQACGKCGGTYSMADMKVIHAADCPWNPDTIAEQRQTRPASIETARFYRTDAPDKLNPRTALVAALEWLDGEVAAGRPVSHVMVITGRDADEHPAASGTRFFQAGTYRHHGQMGLCLEGMHMIRDSGK